MGVARKGAQHALGIGKVARLTEDLALMDDHRVGAENDEHAGELGICQDLLHHGARLALGELLARLGRVGEQIGLERLVDVGGMHGEADAGVGEQLPAARRAAGEDDFECGRLSCGPRCGLRRGSFLRLRRSGVGGRRLGGTRRLRGRFVCGGCVLFVFHEKAL